MSILSITPGHVKAGGVNVEVLGGPLDALTLADIFVQIFGDDQVGALRDEATMARAQGLMKEAFAVETAVTLWLAAEGAYEEVRARPLA